MVYYVLDSHHEVEIYRTYLCSILRYLLFLLQYLIHVLPKKLHLKALLIPAILKVLFVE